MVVLSTETCTINLALTGGQKSPHEVGRAIDCSPMPPITTAIILQRFHCSLHDTLHVTLARETTKTPHKNLGLHQHDWEEGTAELDEDGASARCWLQKKGNVRFRRIRELPSRRSRRTFRCCRRCTARRILRTRRGGRGRCHRRRTSTRGPTEFPRTCSLLRTRPCTTAGERKVRWCERGGWQKTEKAEQSASGGARFLKIIPNNTMLSKLARTATPTCSETRAHRTTSKKGDRLGSLNTCYVNIPRQSSSLRALTAGPSSP